MPDANWNYTEKEIEEKKKRYPWWKDDMKFPVPESLCRACKYRCEQKQNGLCNYTGITHELKKINCTLPQPPYCPYYEKGKAIIPRGAKVYTVKR